MRSLISCEKLCMCVRACTHTSCVHVCVDTRVRLCDCLLISTSLCVCVYAPVSRAHCLWQNCVCTCVCVYTPVCVSTVCARARAIHTPVHLPLGDSGLVGKSVYVQRDGTALHSLSCAGVKACAVHSPSGKQA